jgi:hypothetical protein
MSTNGKLQAVLGTTMFNTRFSLQASTSSIIRHGIEIRPGIERRLTRYCHIIQTGQS